MFAEGHSAMRRLRQLLLLAVIAIASADQVSRCAAAPDAASDPKLAEKVDRLFAAWNRKDSPGCAIAVVRDGRIVYERGYGMAAVEHGVPITPSTVFHVGSMAKQFTAFGVLLLAEE